MKPAILPPDPARQSLIAGLLSLVALAVVVLGVPVWLALHGLVPFLEVPAVISGAVGPHGGSPGHAVTLLAIQAGLAASWICWAWVVCCIAAEVKARITGQPSDRLMGSGSVHTVAAILVGGAFALTLVSRVPNASPTRVATSTSVIGPGRPGLGVVASLADGAHDPTDISTAEQISRPTPVSVHVPMGPDSPWEPAAESKNEDRPVSHTVQARETLWSIAENRLGDGRRWRDIAVANYGTMQADGGALESDHALSVGWTLVLPVAPRPTESFARSGTPSDPSVEPAHQGQAPTGSAPNGTASTGSALVGTVPIAPLGAGIIGVGVADLVDRWRRVQRRRSDKFVSDEPAAAAGEIEQRLRLGDGADEVQAARAAHAAWMGGSVATSRAGSIIGIRVSNLDVRLVFRGPEGVGSVPPLFTTLDDGTAAIRRADLRAADLHRSVSTSRGAVEGQVVPSALAAIGRDSEGVTFVDMGILGPVVVEATGGVADGLIRALALELATSPGWTGFRLLLCGFGGELTRFPHVELLSADQLAAFGIEDDPGSLRTPTVLLCSADTPDDVLDAVFRRASNPESFLTVVGFDSTEAGSRRSGEWPTESGDLAALRITRPSNGEVAFGTGALALFGAVLQPQVVTSDDVTSVIALIESSRPGPVATNDHERAWSNEPTNGGRCQVDGKDPEVSDVLLDQSPHDADGGGSRSVLALRERGGEGSLTMAIRESACEFSTLLDCEIEVAILGPVEIRGADRPFTRAWSKELVVYLAVHPDGASNDNWTTALWPNHLMAPSSLHSTVSVARRSLGQADDGTDHLPRSHGRLMLGPSVSTDWARFLALIESETADSWREALGLVRGRPFEGLRDADWSVLDGTAPLIESTVVEVSGRLAGSCFREGDTSGMEWAARKGLLVSPYDERLYRMLLRAADLAGNPAGVESVMTELVKVVADEREPLASIHPSTLALYRQLSRRPATGVVGRS